MESPGIHDKLAVAERLADLNVVLQLAPNPENPLDYAAILLELSTIIDSCGAQTLDSTKPSSKTVYPEINLDHRSNNLFKLLSRNLVLIFDHLPARLYDYANSLLNNLVTSTDSTTLPTISVASAIVLTDLFAAFPHSLASLISFATTQIYKILKKDPFIHPAIVSLLVAVTCHATKADINAKFAEKLSRLAVKSVMEFSAVYDLSVTSPNEKSNATVVLKREYVLVLKNILILSVLTNYENILAQSAMAGSKVPPELVMSSQHQWQSAMLESYEKFFGYAFANFSQDVRVAAIELMANLMINLVPAEKFNAVEYLVSLYKFPSVDPALMESRLVLLRSTAFEKNFAADNDAESAIQGNTLLALHQTSVIHTIILYLQLEQFQNADFVTVHVTTILDSILSRFTDLAHCQDFCISQAWYKVIPQFTLLIQYISRELGANGLEQLMSYIQSKLNVSPTSDILLTGSPVPTSSGSGSSSAKKRESMFFGKRNGSSTVSKSRGSNGQSIAPFHNTFQAQLLMCLLEQIMPYIIGSADINGSGHVESPSDDADVQDLAQSDLSNSFTKTVLLRFLVNNSYHTRNSALKTLVSYTSHTEVGLNALLSEIFGLVISLSKQIMGEQDSSRIESDPYNYSTLPLVKLSQYALALLALLSNIELRVLQNSLVVKILSFCTQSLKHGNSHDRHQSMKNSACWIILASLVTLYNQSEFVRLNSSQLLVFWKSILSSQFISGRVSEEPDLRSDLAEIASNLKVRNSSLVCLSNYIRSVLLSPDSLKQIQFLLVKSYNYITYLETRLEKAGPVADFRTINETTINPTLAHNILATNSSDSEDENELQGIVTSLIWYGKTLILQSFTVLAPHLRSDINSNMVIFLARVFADTKMFARVSQLNNNATKLTKSKKSASRTSDYCHNAILLTDDNSHLFGITSKFSGYSANIDQLLGKSRILRALRSASNRHASSLSSLVRETEAQTGSWIDELEHLSFASTYRSLHYDPYVLISRHYSVSSLYAPSIITNMVDTSIELFQAVFPHLSLQIQLSLIEQIRLYLTATNIDPYRLEAAHVNVAIALNGVSINLNRAAQPANPEVLSMLRDALQSLPIRNKYLMTIQADSIGVLASLLAKDKVVEMVDQYVALIVSNPDPYMRGSIVLCLSHIFRETSVGFGPTLNAIEQILNDPNPVLYHHALKATAVLISLLPDAENYAPRIISKILANFLNDDYDHSQSPPIWLNLACQFSNTSSVAGLIQVCVTRLGPGISGLGPHDKSCLQSIIVCLSNGIGVMTVHENTLVFRQMLELFSELVIYDSEFFRGQMSFICCILEFIIAKNMKISLATPSPTTMNREAIFPFVSSDDLYRAAYVCYAEIFKIYGAKVLTKESINLLWISLNLKPCLELEEVLLFWMEDSLDMNWFLTLSTLLKSIRKKLVGPYIDQNYRQKLLPLVQRQKKRTSASMTFIDEEAEGIVVVGEQDQEKAEPISMEVRLFIYKLFNKLLTLAFEKPKLKAMLRVQIQEIVNIAFLGSTAPLGDMKIEGLQLLDKTLKLFGDMVDPSFPDTLILEQEQAQIISALMPCFNRNSSARVMVQAISVSSTFLNLPNLKFYSKRRILNTLTNLLEELSASKYILFGFLERVSEYDRKLIQLSILNCWALLQINAKSPGTTADPELMRCFEKYSRLLTTLWILMLREYSATKFNDSNPAELEIYGAYWVTFIRVLTIELKENPAIVSEFLGEESGDFFYILFCECVEAMIKKTMLKEVLECVDCLARESQLVEYLFEPQIFGEVINLFERSLLVDQDPNTTCSLITITASLFHTFYDSHSDNIEGGFDQLFELIRVVLMPLFATLPFLKTNYDPHSHGDSTPEQDLQAPALLMVVKYALDNVTSMVARLPDVVKIDNCACLFFIFAKIYETNVPALAEVALPYLTKVIKMSKEVDPKLVQTFSNTIHTVDYVSSKHFAFTSTVLIAQGGVEIDEASSRSLALALTELLNNDGRTAIACIKQLTQSDNGAHLRCLKYLVEDLSKQLYRQLQDGDTGPGPQIAFEVFVMLMKITTEEQALILYSFLIPLLLMFHETTTGNTLYVRDKLMALINHNPGAFKVVISQKLEKDQGKAAESLLRPADTQPEPTVDEDVIELKVFGEDQP